jgi:hypothetical protein
MVDVSRPLDGQGGTAHTEPMTLKSIKFKPVAWMTGLLTVLVAAEAVDRVAHLLPAAWTPYLLGAIAVLTAVLGRLAHGAVTPLAAPRDNAGMPLVPKWAQSPGTDPATTAPPRPSTTGDIGGAGMSSW